MEPAGRLQAALGHHGAAVLAESKVPELTELLHGAPPYVTSARGPALIARLRDWHASSGRLLPALALTRGLLAVCIDARGHEHPDSLTELGALGALIWRSGRVEEGGKLLTSAFKALRAVADDQDLRLAVVAGNHALALVKAGELEQAEYALELALRRRRALAPQTTGIVAAQLGEVRVRLGKLELARDA